MLYSVVFLGLRYKNKRNTWDFLPNNWISNYWDLNDGAVRAHTSMGV